MIEKGARANFIHSYLFHPLPLLASMLVVMTGCGEAVEQALDGTVNDAPTARSVSITDDNGGLAVIGDTLTGNYSYNDDDGDPEGVTTFRWLRDGVAIPGAVAATYTIVSADIDTAITFEVTPIASIGVPEGSPVTSAAINAVNSPPVASSVTITDDNGGLAFVGDGLTATYSYSDFESDAEGTSSYQWYRDGAAITGATGLTYTLAPADSQTSITFEVTPAQTLNAITGSPAASNAIDVENSPPTATALSISFSGSAIVGNTYTGNYTFNDVDLDAEGTSTYQWYIGGVAISGATNTAYTTVASDNSQTLTFEVTPVDDSGLAGTPVVSGGVAILNSAPVASSVSFTDDNGGDLIVTDTLTGSYTFTDIDADAEGTSTFRWLRNGAPIGGATASTYTVVPADSGTDITFEVTPVAATGTSPGSAVTSSAMTVLNNPPTATPVTITDDNGGTLGVGDTLTGGYTYSDVDGDAEGTSILRWKRDGVIIGGAVTANYTVIAADTGTTITFEVTPVAATGTSPGTAGTSSGLTVVNSAPVASSVNVLDTNGGSTVVGDLLFGSYTYNDVDSDAEGSTQIQWYRDGIAIIGANALAYSVVAADADTTLTLEITPAAASGESPGLPVTSADVIVVNSAPTATFVSISDGNGGNPLQGETLTGNYVYSDVDGDAESGTTFRWLRDGAAIGGATSNTYVLKASDISAEITFEVTPGAATGTSPGTPVVSAILLTGSPPTATGVNVTDDNGGYAVVGDQLTGNYTFNDDDGDSEGTSTYRWFRDSVEIVGATNSTYTLVDADFATNISFEVTPVAAAGTSPGTAVTSADFPTGSPPVVNGMARFLDLDMSSTVNVDDQLIIPFDQDIVLNSTAVSDLNLPVSGDSFGTGATVAAGPGSNEVTVTLGTSPSLKSRQDYDGTTTSNSPSGVDVSGSIAADTIEGNTGFDAVASTAIDVIPALVDSAQTLGSVDSRATALGDVDNDGDLDMVVSNWGSGIEVWLNNGSGSFSNSGQTVDSIRSYSVALGDLDGDGDLDMAVANQLSLADRIYFNNGSGTFSSGQSLGSSSTFAVALGDVDNDGDLDLATASDDTGGSLIYINNGSGSFTDSGQSLSAGYNSTFVTFGDVNKDGYLDLALINRSLDENHIFLNDADGTGNFTDSAQTLGNYTSYSAAFADVDGNGSLDLVVGNNGDLESNRVYTNDGTGVFTDSGQALATGSNTRTIALADIDGDSDLDIVMGTNALTLKPNLVYVNDGSGTFTDSGQELTTSHIWSIAAGDVDKDGDNDVIMMKNGSNLAFLNSLTGTWGSVTFNDSAQSLGTAASKGIALGDVDNNGSLDMIVANDGGANKIWSNNGSGSFSDSGETLDTNSASRGVALGDLDNDGWLDIVIANNGSANKYWSNDGTGSFSDSGETLDGGSPTASYAVAIGDLDADGWLDFVIANYGENNKVWLNDGSASFSSSNVSSGTEDSTAIALGDVNGDGSLDIVVANDGASNEVFSNNGSGSFTAIAQTLGSAASLGVALGDVDGDGDLDMVVANNGTTNVVHYNDNNSGDFDNLTAQSLGDTDNSYAVTLKDVDGDGDLDAIFANSGAANTVWLNNGSGTFSNSGASLGTAASQAIAAGDVNNDGDVDIVVGNNGAANKVYDNE